ncbi:cytochrome P450 [Streptomyces spongiae]|uniref:Cytochrome P450 n=1 Tax=Streptomyces spongiae TaxID=565072 RepID=A0A5N8XBL3_9ACTN|nr:cytochrome P450 [Streptomyces spongiae]MPY55915.1 cytochrome P450 [Streptomyces spongiae]
MHSVPPTPVTELPALEDLFTFDEFSRDFVEAARELRHRARTSLLRGPENSLVVLRNRDARALAANPQVGNMPAEILFWMATEMDLGSGPVTKPEPEQTAGFDRFLRNQVFTSNPPLHQPNRNILARQLMPRNILPFAPLAERLAQELVEEALERQQIDFVHEFAGRYATRFWAGQLGMTRDEATHVQALMEEMNLTFLLTRSPEQSEQMFSGVDTYMDVVGEAVRRAWAKGDNELLHAMAADLAKLDIEGKPEDIGTFVAANFFDGFHTVAVALVNVFFRLLGNSAAHARVRAEPSLVTNAFHEGTRLESPLMVSQRLALQDIEYEGVFIPAGTPVVMVWAAANRDPEVFTDPDDYHLDRPVQHGTTFGGGAHLCPGRNAARMLTEIALTTLTAPDLDVALVDHEHAWVPNSLMRHLTELPVTVRRVSR